MLMYVYVHNSTRQKKPHAQLPCLSLLAHGILIVGGSDMDLNCDMDDSDLYDENIEEEKCEKECLHNQKKRGRKGTWMDEELDDMVDIIVNDEGHKKKLILQNATTKSNTKNYEQIWREMKERAKKRGQVFTKEVSRMRNKFKNRLAY